MSATLKDIAGQANITQQAVSLALRGHPSVSAVTAEKVRRIARKLNYRPNLHARNLRGGGTKTVGFVFPDITYSYAQDIVEGARSVLDPDGYLGILGLTSWDSAREHQELEQLLGFQVEGLICQPTVDGTETYERVAKSGTPVVFVSNGLDIPGTGWIGYDGYDAGTKVMNHLLGLGHRRIAFVCTDSTVRSLSLAPIRAAYLASLDQAQIALEGALLRTAKLGNPQSVRDEVDRLLELDSSPTAIYAISDSIAYTVMDQLMRRGVRVPQDISVAGSGGLSPSNMEMISLTTVVGDGRRIGAMAAKCLTDMLAHPDQPPLRTRLEYGPLIHRRSTGAPRTESSLGGAGR